MPRLPPARSAALRRRLLGWWGAARRELPWRFPAGEADPYRVWISEAMLQQTQVATVIPYYCRFLDRFPTIRALAAASEEEVLAAWSGLGYYARGRALRRAAQEAVARHGGLPRTVAELRELPGVGPYTAGAVASIAFGVRAAAVDGNVARVLSRILLVTAGRDTPRFRDAVWAAAATLVGAEDGPGAGRGPRRGEEWRPGDLNQALMELGALLCRPVAPRCDRCPVESLCAARRAGRERAIPPPRRRAGRRRLVLAVGVCTSRGRVLLVRRPGRGLFAGMWAPPAVELGAGEDARRALSTAIGREPSARTGGFRFVGSVERALTHRHLDLRVHVARLTRLPRGAGGWRLAEAADIGALAVPEAMRRALALAGVDCARPGKFARTGSEGVGTRGENV